jgi:hypothetical protein
MVKIPVVVGRRVWRRGKLVRETTGLTKRHAFSAPPPPPPKKNSAYDRVYECTPSSSEIGTMLGGCYQGQLCREHAAPTAAMYSARKLD